MRLPRQRGRTKRNGPGHLTWAAPVSAPSGAALASVASALTTGGMQPAHQAGVEYVQRLGGTCSRPMLTRLRRLLRMRAITFLHLLFPPPAYRHPRAQRSRPPPRADVSLGVSS